MQIDYIAIAAAVIVLVVFFKIGDMDERLSGTIGLIVGVIVAGAYLLFPYGVLSLILYAAGGIALLTAYKLISGGKRKDS